jgi:hypothetical protein
VAVAEFSRGDITPGVISVLVPDTADEEEGDPVPLWSLQWWHVAEKRGCMAEYGLPGLVTAITHDVWLIS